MKVITDAVLRNTPIKKVSRTWVSRHPWLRNSSEYDRTRELKINAKRNFLIDPSKINKDVYSRACFVNSDVYERERTLFLTRAINDTKGNTHEFYSLMKSGSKVRKETPENMLYKGVYVKEEGKLRAFATQLNSCFLQDTPSLGSNSEEVDEKLFDIYQMNFSEDYNHIWADFELRITTETVL